MHPFSPCILSKRFIIIVLDFSLSNTITSANSITAYIPSSIQHSADAHNSPGKQTQTQPLQSSSAALTTHNLSSNDIFSRWKHQPRKGMLSGSASAGGELILGRRESALFFKSPLSERQQAASSDF